MHWCALLAHLVLLVQDVCGEEPPPCLRNAVPPQDRIPVVVDGVSMPVGVWAYTWESAELNFDIHKMIIEEVLGYQTIESGRSGIVVSGLWAIAGCREPIALESEARQRCELEPGRAVSTTHVAVETWDYYLPTTLKELAELHPLRQPLKLGGPAGNMGFFGLSANWLPKEAFLDGFKEGVMLDGRGYYNASVFNPAKYFTTVPELNTTAFFASARRCSDFPPMNQDGDARNYLRHFPEDQDGIESYTENGVTKLRARCEDGVWWMSPACRRNVSRCIPWISVDGWGYNIIWHKVTAFDMPVAMASTSSMADWIDVIYQNKVLNYAWVPDTSFLSRGLMQVIFPRYNKDEQADRLYNSELAQVYLESWVHRGLEAAAPRLWATLNAIQMTGSVMDEMLLLKVTQGNTSRETACEFMRRHEDMWSQWVPAITDCFPGQGLVDVGGGELRCETCPRGKASVPHSSVAGSRECVECDLGKYQPLVQQSECVPCDVGKYTATLGAHQCEMCEQGRYNAEEGRTECSACPPRRTTKVEGARELSACLCEAGHYEPSGLAEGNYTCEVCAEQLECPLNSRMSAWTEENSTLPRESIYPRVKPSFYAELSDPTKIYKCRNEAECPGGAFNTCGSNRGMEPEDISESTGLVCGTCRKRFYRSFNGDCVECGHVELTYALVPTIQLLAAPFFCLIVYMATKDPFVSEFIDAPPRKISLLLSIVLVQMQTVGIIKSMTLNIPETTLEVWEVGDAVNQPFRIFRPACAGDGSMGNFQSQYIIRSVQPLSVCICFFLTYLGSRIISKLLGGPTDGGPRGLVTALRVGMQGPQTFNACATVLFTFCIAVFQLAFELFQCYSHPSGMQSLVKAPEVACQSPDWWSLIGVGLSAVLFYGVLPQCVFCYILYVAPTRFHSMRFRAAWKFLVVKWRPGVWWWSVPFLLRGFFLSLTNVVFESPNFQVLWVAFVQLAYLYALMVYTPWRHIEGQRTDGFVTAFMTCATMCCFLWAERRLASEGETFANFAMPFCFIPMAFILWQISYLTPSAVKYLMGDHTGSMTQGIHDTFKLLRQIQNLHESSLLDLFHATATCTPLERLDAQSTLSCHLCEVSFSHRGSARAKSERKSAQKLVQRTSNRHSKSGVGALGGVSSANEKFKEMMGKRIPEEDLFSSRDELPADAFREAWVAAGGEDSASYAEELLDLQSRGVVTRAAYAAMLKHADEISPGGSNADEIAPGEGNKEIAPGEGNKEQGITATAEEIAPGGSNADEIAPGEGNKELDITATAEALAEDIAESEGSFMI